MFGRIYAGELKKLFKPKSMIVLAVVLIVLLVGTAIVYNLLNTLMGTVVSGDMNESVAGIVAEESYSFNEETLDDLIKYAEETLRDTEREYKEAKGGYMSYSTLFGNRAQLAALNYIKENKLYDQDVRILGVNYNILNISHLTAEGFASQYMSNVILVMTIYAIVVGAGLLADEYKNGTIKLLMTRPIGKNQLITAKLLAVLTISVGIASLFTLIGFIYGLIAFPTETTRMIYLVFNAKTVFRSTVGGYLFGSFFMSIVKMCVLCLLAYFIGTILRKKTAGIIITIIIQLGIISGIIGLLPVEIALLTPNMSLMNYFVPGGSVPIYGNFYLSLAIYIVYIGLITFGLYYSFNKRDVI